MDLLRLAQECALDFVAMVFLLAGTAKLASLERFRDGLYGLPYMRVSWATPLAWVLPPLEIATAIGLLCNRIEAKAAAAVLLILFSLLTGVILARKLKVECNCFGGLGERYYSGKTLVENGALLALLAFSAPLSACVNRVLGPLFAAFVLQAYVIGTGILRNAREIRTLKASGILR